ncbi:hypothetical protein HYN48_14210 [Flavobacterium magnum]|uniref:Uncharacterized protein n=1 Tax=Flavobacterium magnum TaxID=2162713 RepID=A0A2S0RHD1_9FLAO|nr:hypothetical protein [Flavobacterium magnum]AWA31153.1 hypothetical protein HYN48_14210 [Flavobacterium magnum]
MLILFILFFLVVFVIIPIGLGISIYKLLRRNNKQKSANYFAIIYTSVLILVAINLIFEDELFTKSDAENLVTEQHIFLKDDFKLTENKSMSAVGDYYHTFTLEISTGDKERAINKIKTSSGFKIQGEKITDYLYENVNRYKGPTKIQNYETKDSFVREYFKPNGKGYAPTFRRISIDKLKNQLVFEDMDE